ncbi:MAG: ATP-binding protein [Myxococcales bacterium]|nr:GAF domain-containing protein [Myxococcales bacterium]
MTATELIRGFVEVAVAAQQQRTLAEFFDTVRKHLREMGLTSTVVEVEGARFRFAPFAPALTQVGAEVRERLAGWQPLSRLPLDVTHAEGMLVEDLPAFLARMAGVPDDAYRGRVPPRAIVATIPDVDRTYVLSCSGENLDGAVAGAFGLLARQLAAAVQTTRQLEELTTRAEEMALLNEIARQLAGSLEVGRLLELGGESLKRILGGELWFVMLPEPDGLHFAGLRPEDADLASVVMPFDQPTTAVRAFKAREPVQVIAPLAPDAAPLSLRMVERFGHKTTLAVPLLARDEVLGVAVVLARQERTFTRAEIDRARAVAGQLGLALLSARLYDDLRRSYAELAQAQKELIDRERLAALGELSASIAHEVRNPLGVIFNSVGSLKRILKPEGDAALLLDIIGEEADRLNGMVGALLDYSRPVQPALQPLPLRPLLDEALGAARQQVGAAAEQVKVQLRVAPEVATVRADGRLLRQALINLFLNAYQAMPRGGVLEVRAALAEGSVEIAIRDSGPGIPADARAKVFQAFFTTKATGTGLGLAVVRRIVEGHGGSIGLAQDVKNGAEFSLRLPIAD